MKKVQGGVIELPAELLRERVLGIRETAAFLGCSVMTVRRQYRTGGMPPPIRISDRLLGFRVGTLIDLLTAKNSENAA